MIDDDFDFQPSTTESDIPPSFPDDLEGIPKPEINLMLEHQNQSIDGEEAVVGVDVMNLEEDSSLAVADDSPATGISEEHATDGETTKQENTATSISFKGHGRCSCGCGSYVGTGKFCTACKHSYEAHSRHKK